MSLILDALNKADRENRKPESSPNLETEHAQPIELPAKSSQFILDCFGAIHMRSIWCGSLFYIQLNQTSSTNRSQVIERLLLTRFCSGKKRLASFSDRRFVTDDNK